VKRLQVENDPTDYDDSQRGRSSERERPESQSGTLHRQRPDVPQCG
jgi:hypothetical protein